MPEQKIIQDPNKNAYQVGIAHRLRVEPKRVNCFLRINPQGGFLIDVQVDGRDLNGVEQKLVAEYLEEALHGFKPTLVDG